MSDGAYIVAGAVSGVAVGLIIAFIVWSRANKEKKNALLSDAERAYNATSDPTLKAKISNAAIDYSKFTVGELVGAGVVGLIAAAVSGAFVMAIGGTPIWITITAIVLGAGVVVALLWMLQSQDEKYLQSLTMTVLGSGSPEAGVVDPTTVGRPGTTRTEVARGDRMMRGGGVIRPRVGDFRTVVR